MERVLSISRTERGLVEVVATFSRIDWTQPHTAAKELTERPNRVAIERRPVTTLGDLSGMWQRAQHPRRPDAAMVRDALELAGQTVLPNPRTSGPFVQSIHEVRPIRATAAHPRAYKGTQDRRPKPPAAPPLVLADLLLDPRATRSFLQEQGAPGVADDPLVDLCGFDGSALRPAVRELMWSNLRRQQPSLVARAIAATRHDEEATIAASAWILATREPGDAIDWIEWASGLTEDLRGIALAVVGDIESRRPRFDPAYVGWLAGGGGEPAHFAMELRAMLDALTAGAPPHYRRSGIELMRGIAGPASVLGSTLEGVAPVETLRTIGELLDASGVGSYPVAAAWDACGRVPALGPAIDARDWRSLSPEVAADLLWLLGGGLGWDGDDVLTNADWCAAHAADFEAGARDLPPARARKFLDELYWIATAWDERTTRRCGGAAIVLAQRLADVPFKPVARPVWAWNSFLEYAPAAQLNEFLELPPSVWRSIDAACTRRNHSDAIGAGVDDLARALGGRTIDFVREAPAALMKTARTVGLISDASRAALIADWRAEHAEGEPRDALRALHKSLAQTVLAAVGVADDRADEGVLHAALLRRSITPNRRALTRFLRRYLAGDTDYLTRHPLTRDWLDRHAHVEVDRALRTPARVVTLPGLGSITIGIETNPLEVLRLGTYVGSCLSLGGAFDYSAAAVALDVNKVVVYARNRRGSVLARQLFAISDDDHLVPCSVYPASAPTTVAHELAAFGRLLAEALGIAMLPDDARDEYEIELVVANEWWDDGAA